MTFATLGMGGIHQVTHEFFSSNNQQDATW